MERTAMSSDDQIKRHVDGHRQTLRAITMVLRGFAPDETAERLLYALAGNGYRSELIDPKKARRLSNRLRHAADALANSVHSLHLSFLEPLQEARLVPSVPDNPETDDEISSFVEQQVSGDLGFNQIIAHLTGDGPANNKKQKRRQTKTA
jgi:hypothetical protein